MTQSFLDAIIDSGKKSMLQSKHRKLMQNNMWQKTKCLIGFHKWYDSYWEDEFLAYDKIMIIQKCSHCNAKCKILIG